MALGQLTPVNNPAFVHVEHFLQVPTLNASFDPSTPGSPSDAELGLLFGSNKNWEYANIAGTNTVAQNAGGGLLLTTGTSTNDSPVLQPRATTLGTVATGLNVMTMLPSEEPRMEFRLEGQTSIDTTATAWGGLKLTNVNTIATDNDQAYFRIANGVISAVYSVAGTDYEQALNTTAVADGFQRSTYPDTVSFDANSAYTFTIRIDEDRKPYFYINTGAGDRLVAKGTTAMTASAALKPYIGLATGADAARTLLVRYATLRRNYGV